MNNIILPSTYDRHAPLTHLPNPFCNMLQETPQFISVFAERELINFIFGIFTLSNSIYILFSFPTLITSVSINKIKKIINQRILNVAMS